MSSVSENEFMDEFEAIDGKDMNINKISNEIVSRKIEIKVPDNLNWSSKNRMRFSVFYTMISFHIRQT